MLITSLIPLLIGSTTVPPLPIFQYEPVLESEGADLTGFANNLPDINGRVDCSSFDLIYSTAGNGHHALTPAMHELAAEQGWDNWLYTTSPPIVVKQLEGGLSVGNYQWDCQPTLFSGPSRLVDRLIEEGLAVDKIPFYANYGNAIIVPIGNPDGVFLDNLDQFNLGISNPDLEPGSYRNFMTSLESLGYSAEDLSLVACDRVMHRCAGNYVARPDAGEAIADGFVTFRHLALGWQEQFPGQFEVIDIPEARYGGLYLTRIVGDWSEEQRQTREATIEFLLSEEFIEDLEANHLRRWPEAP